MYIIYQISKFLVWVSFRLYYPKATVLNSERLKFDHPAIVVSNHPNTLLDVLNVAYRCKKQVFFLANASMFATKLSNWFFTHFYCIPIRRQKDKNTNINNAESFARCDDFLSKGGCLYIAPEGVSVMQRGLRSVKKGAARIALSAENQNNFQLGLKIVPVGLTYDAPNYFRSRLNVQVAEPIDVSSFKNLYERNPSKAAAVITELMEERLQANLLTPKDEIEDQLLHFIEEIDRNEHPTKGLATYERSETLLQQIQQKNAKQPHEFMTWQQNITAYFDTLKQLNINDKAVFDTKNKISLVKNILLLIAGFPFFIYGFINNALAVLSALAITRKANAYVGYNSTIKILAGLFLTFPLFYGLQVYFIYQYSHSLLWTLLYVMSLIPLGIVAWDYWVMGKQTLSTWRFRRFVKRNTKEANAIISSRQYLSKQYSALDEFT